MEILKEGVHYFFHFVFPAVVAFLFFRDQWKRVYLVFLLTMLVDLDHLLAKPLFDACRCSIGFHPLHSYLAILAYGIMVLHPKLRVMAIGLLLHMVTDSMDCFLLMLHVILYINWNINPEIFRIGGFALRYYSLMFALAFILSYVLLSRIYTRDNISLLQLNKLAIFLIVGTILGARLGHTLFYEFGYYKDHLLEIILPFRVTNGKFELTGYQGLASHGGAIGIIAAVLLYCRKYKQSFLWIMDRLAISVSLSAFFIRLGNLFNSEIIGRPTELPWAFIFERVDMIPRHPAQLYEAISYLIVFWILWYLYKSKASRYKNGFLLGCFLTMLFTVRFLVEFVKENQEAFENKMLINMGQILSIPFILIGVYLIVSKSKKTSIRMDGSSEAIN